MNLEIHKLPQLNKANTNDSDLQLSPIQLNPEYCAEWNEQKKDFVVLTKNGELISNTLYRVGGFTVDVKQDYFTLLRYEEAVYSMASLREYYPDRSDKVLESQRKYLEGCWCILDKNGVEKKVFERFKTPYIKKGSCIYSIDDNYYNIETGEFYCKSLKSMDSTEYLFLETPYDEDLSKRGVMKINKKDGTWSVFK